MKYILIMMTWFGAIVPMKQELEKRDEAECEKMKANIEASWEGSPREFVGVVECVENPLYKKKKKS